MPQGKPTLKKQARPAGNKLNKHIQKDRKPKPAKNTELVKLRKVEIDLILGVLTSFQKLTAQLAQQIETTMAEKAASAGARLNLLKIPEGAKKGKPKST